MPELSKDPFGDAMTRAFLLRDAPSIHDWNPNEPSFYGQDYGSMMFKPLHYGQENQSKFPGMSTPRPPRPDPVDSFLRPACYFPLDSELKPQHSVESYLPYGSALNHIYQPPPLEVPEIDESSNWMSEVLHDFPSISTHELSPMPPLGRFSFDLLPPPDQSPSVDLPISLPTGLVPDTEDASAAPTTPHLTTSVGTIIRGVSNPLSKIFSATKVELVSTSPTPKPLKPQRNKRPQKAAEKPKKVTNAEQKEHVRRERQRRDDMSFKILTLECLLPPVGPNSKRDRASVVHDSVHYLKYLQNQVEGLEKTFSEMKLNKPRRSAAVVRGDCVKPDIAACKCDSSMAKLVEYHIQVEGESTARLEKCRCRPDYKSRAMKVLEQLHLDICRCTITRMCDYTLCVISAKPRLTSSQVVSSFCVVNALRSSIEIS